MQDATGRSYGKTVPFRPNWLTGQKGQGAFTRKKHGDFKAGKQKMRISGKREK
jgi:hypothetical protein